MFWVKTIFERLVSQMPWFRRSRKRGLEKAAEFYWERLREEVSTPYPPASQPYTSPHLRTGDGRDSIKVDRHAATIDRDGNLSISVDLEPVGAKGPYMRYLDEGTQNIEPRPFISITYNKYYDELIDIVNGG